MIYLKNIQTPQELYIPYEKTLKEERVLKYATEAYVDSAISEEASRADDTYLKKGELPEGLATEEYVDNAISMEIERADEAYMKKGDVPTDVYTKEETDQKIEEVRKDIPSLDGYATEGYVDSAITDEVKRADDTYAKKGELPTDVYTKEETDAKLKEVEDKIPSLDGYATEDWVKDQGYLTEHQDISGKADKTYVDEKIEEVEDKIPSIEGLATKEYVDGEIERVEGLIPSVEGLASEEYVNNAVEAEKQRSEGVYAKKEDIPSLDGYATEDWVNEQGFLKEHQDISGKADITYVDEEIQKVKDEIPSIEGLASETYVDTAISNEVERADEAYMKKGDVPTDVYTKSETDELIADVRKDIPSVEGLASETYVDGKIEEVEGKIPSVEGLASEEWVNNQGFLKEHQSLDGYATEDWVNEQGFLKEHQDISGKADKTYVDGEIERVEGEIPSLDGYATEGWVEGKGYLTEHQQLKTINGETIVGTGDIEIQGGSEPVLVVEISSSNTISKEDAEKMKAFLENPETANGKMYFHTADAFSNNAYELAFYKIYNQAVPYYQLYTNTFLVTLMVTDAAAYVVEQELVRKNQLNSYATHSWVNNQGFLKEHQSLEGYATEDWVEDQGFLTEHQPLKTINHQSIIGTGNIDIQGGGGGGGETVIELTQAEYDALEVYADNTTYIITDSPAVDLDEYAKQTDVTALQTEIAKKADKVSVAASTSGYKFPTWNDQGVITGNYGTAYQKSMPINNTYYNFYATNSTTMPAMFVPTTAGTKGQPLLSNGSGAPVWGSYKFEFISQSAYDALATKDATTIYFIISED